MHLTKYRWAVLALIVTTLIWSAASPIFKWSLSDAPPFALAFYRFLLATLIILPFVIRKIKVRFEDLHKLFILSLAGITLHIVFFYLGLSLTPSINAPIISSITPIFLILCAVLFLKEKPKTKVIVGTLTSLIGVAIIIFRPILESTSFGSILGNLYLMLSVIAIVAYTVLLKKYNLKYNYATTIFWLFLLGTLSLFPMYLIEMQTVTMQITDVRGIIGIVYGAIFSSTLAYLLYSFSTKHMKANEIGIFSYIEPFATAIVAIPLLGETITATYLFGALFVFAGIFIAEARLHFHPSHNLKATHPKVE